MSTAGNAAAAPTALPTPAPAAADTFDTLAPSPRELMKRRARRHPGLIIGVSILVSMTLLAVLAPLLAPHDPYAQDLTKKLLDPVWGKTGSWSHPLGTDNFGRDVLSPPDVGCAIVAADRLHRRRHRRRDRLVPRHRRRLLRRPGR